MRTLSVLRQLIAKTVPIHAKRLNAVMAAVQSLTLGVQARVTSLGRYVTGTTFDKHKIKRMDRLLSNPHLYQERSGIYTALTRRVVKGLAEPIILIDWSPLCADLGANIN